MIGSLDNRGEVWRQTESRGKAGRTADVFAKVADAWIGVEAVRVELENTGGGDMPRGSVVLVSHRQAGLAERDVVKLRAGPYEGTTWQVRGTATVSGGLKRWPAEPYTSDEP